MKKITFIIIIGLTLYGCQNDDDFTNPTIVITAVDITDEQFATVHFGNSVEANFIGRIVNKAGNKLKDVQVAIGNQTTMTDHNGVFVLNNTSVYEKFAFIKATKNGYIQGSRSLVPTPNGTNDVQITLLEKNIVGMVGSGEASEVSLPNGAKVQFQGDFIDASGNPYNGEVQVSLHYLEPNQQETFTQMPGMLFGQRESGSASGMETYGMLGVDLYSSAGEQLNIAESSMATLIFPVAASTPNAPDTIPLWYFDEVTGYWKEQGQAVKIGNEYVTEVTHFTWWNCDLPLDYVKVCFELKSHAELANYYVEIIRNLAGQQFFGSYTNSEGQECGFLPANEEVTIKVYSDCMQNVLYEEIVGPYSNDTTIEIIVPSFSDIIETNITAGIETCASTMVNNGYAVIFNNIDVGNINKYIFVPIINGTIDYNFSYCSNNDYSIMFFDTQGGYSTDITPLNLTSGATDLGSILTCTQNASVYNGNISFFSTKEINYFGLYGYEKINGNIRFRDNYTDDYSYDITDLSALSTLTEVTGDISFYDINGLTSLDGLENLTTIGGKLDIEVAAINSLNGLSSLNSLGSLRLDGIPISNLQGLENLSYLGEFSIVLMPLLSSLEGLEGLNSINGHVTIGYADILNLDGLNNLSYIGGHLTIGNTNNLVSLSGLNSLTEISGGVFIGTAYVNGAVYVAENTNLTNLCALQNLFTNGSYGAVNIANNAYNPTVQDIIDGNCSQ